ncbi:hypothetical protein RM764_37605 [Streptomyces sp. DSM 41699]|uniref:Uncharacterized protein n=1 Tax=Streptomyces gibsoniae TaxID=3075529 RepID=A0ABU2U632_9ACTN|nr:hypothetical protein [Streptomyces sp. DSM 41699]
MAFFSAPGTEPRWVWARTTRIGVTTIRNAELLSWPLGAATYSSTRSIPPIVRDSGIFIVRNT